MNKINTIILVLAIFVLLTPLVEGSCPTINTQPLSQTVCAGSTATFTVVASLNGGTGPTYQWQRSINGGTSWSSLSGQTAATLTLTSVTTGMNNYQYRVVVKCSGSGCSCSLGTTSNAATLTVNSPPTITTQPSAQIACIGNTATFPVVASGSYLSYQWQYSTDGGTNWASVSGGSGGTTSSYTTISATTGMNGYQYRVVVTNSGCQAATSNAATLTVNPTITTQLQSATVCVGSTATFTVVASGSSLSYQWQYYNAGTWVSVTDGSGGTTPSYTTSSATVGMNGRQYQVVVTGGSCSTKAISSTVTLTVNSPPTITTQPSAQTACIGNTATFTVAATGSSLSYQWQYSTDGGTNWASASGGSGGTTSSYTTGSATTGMNNYQYRVVLTGTCGSATSNAATLTVNPTTSINTQPSAQTVCAGSSPTFNAAADGSSQTYQWYQNTGSGWTSILGKTAATLTLPSVTTDMSGYQYKVVVTGTCGSPITSNAATLTVNPTTSINTQPSSQTVCAGSTATFTVAAAGSNLTYQWRQSTNGGTSWSDILGQTAVTLTLTSVTTGMSGYQYHVVVTGTCGSPITSNAATLTVNPTTSITTQPSSQAVFEGVTATFTVAAAGSSLTYQWQQSTNGGTSWSGLSGQTAATLTLTSVTTGMSGYQYRVVVTGTCGSPITSNAAILTVQALNPAVSITKTASPNQGSPGTNVDFGIRVTNTGNVALNIVKVVEVLPTGLTYVSNNNSGTANGKIITWTNVGPLSSGSSTSIDLVASIDGSKLGTLNNNINATGTPPIGNSVVSATTATVQALNPGVSITKTPSPSQGSPGTNVNFGIVVKNTGSDTLSTVKVVDVLPAGLIYISDNNSGTANGKTITWTNVGPLTAGRSVSIGLVTQVDGTKLGTLTNNINVTGTPPTGNSIGSQTTANVLVQGITDNDLTGDTGDYCTDGTSTYTVTKDGPGLTYQWYLGPINTNPATQIISGYYTAGITPSSITSRTSSIAISWASLVPSLKDSLNQAVPPNSGTFTVTLKITQGGTLQKTINKTVNLVPKPNPVITFNP